MGQATVHITVTDDCSALAFEDFYEIHVDTPLSEVDPGFLANDVAECEPYSASITGVPAHGSVTDNGGGAFDYVPNPGFGGYDSFPYQIQDANNVVLASGVVSIHVLVCDAIDDAYTTPMDQTLTVAAPGVLANDPPCPKSRVARDRAGACPRHRHAR